MSARTVQLAIVLPVAAVLVAVGGYIVMHSFGFGWAQTPKPTRDQFASDRAPREAEKPAVDFDAERSMKYLEQLCGIGTRISGSEGMRKQRELLVKHFEEHGAKVRLQEFRAKQRSQPEITMANLIASWHPERTRRVILCAHYDTRPYADQERNRRSEPFVSANDGTSGVALLMEFARLMKDLPTGVGVDFVLFDGEEYVFSDPGLGRGAGDRYFFGSDHFANEYVKQLRQPGAVEYKAAILLDLFAGKDAVLDWEPNSVFNAGPLVENIWRIAEEQGCRAFVPNQGVQVEDDHVALNRVGIPAIDIIDMRYKHWHRLSDTPENCSADRMGQVARVLTIWLQRLK